MTKAIIHLTVGIVALVAITSSSREIGALLFFELTAIGYIRETGSGRAASTLCSSSSLHQAGLEFREDSRFLRLWIRLHEVVASQDEMQTCSRAAFHFIRRWNAI